VIIFGLETESYKMALPKKSSRKIVVDGTSYRWAFFENSGWNDITIQSESGNGSKLHAHVNWDEYDPEQQGISGWYSVVLPKFIAKTIQLAIVKGWKPEVSGTQFSLRLESPKSSVVKIAGC